MNAWDSEVNFVEIEGSFAKRFSYFQPLTTCQHRLSYSCSNAFGSQFPTLAPFVLIQIHPTILATNKKVSISTRKWSTSPSWVNMTFNKHTKFQSIEVSILILWRSIWNLPVWWFGSLIYHRPNQEGNLIPEDWRVIDGLQEKRCLSG